MKRLLSALPFLLLVALLAPPMAFGQGTLVLSGTVADSTDGAPLAFANVAVFAGDSLIGGAVTDEEGFFRIPALKPGPYHIRISYLGYANYERTRTLTADLNLGQVPMRRAGETLQAVDIVGEAPAARQRGDTTQYNAGSFKVNPDATTENLIEKMPGVSIENGQVKVQGQQVQQVLVDGKQFFGDDPTQALQNLPADMVDKVQVYDQLSEQAQFSGFDDGQRKRTINIVTKQSRRQGYFGRAYAGYGYNDKYAAGLALNRFDGDRRITILGQANNINQQNFQSTDLLGVLNTGGGRGTGGQGRGGDGRRGPGSGFGALVNTPQQSGITTTQAGGVNYTDAPAKWLDVRGSYFFNRASNVADQSTNRRYVGTEQAGLTYAEQSLDRSVNLNHRAFFRLEFKLDSNNILLTRPRINIQNNTLSSSNNGRSDLLLLPVSRTLNDYSQGQNALDVNNDLEYRHRFRKPGRTISLNLNTGFNTQKGLTNRNTRNAYYLVDSATTGLDSTSDLLLQDVQTRSRNLTLGTSLSYTEPLSRKTILQLTYRSNAQMRTSSRYTHDLELGGITLDSLSNALKSDYLANEGGVGVRYNGERFRLGANLEYQHADLRNRQTYPFTARIDRAFNAILPQAEVQYKFSESRNLFLNLRSSTQVPSTSQLQAVVNNINSLQLSTGNPDLKQQYLNAALFRYTSTWGGGKVFTGAASGNFYNDYIGNSTVLAGADTARVPLPNVTDGALLLPPGAQLTRPENLGHRYEAFGFLSLGLPIAPLKSNVNLSGNYTFSNTPSLINGARNESNSSTWAGRAGIGSNISESVDFTLSSLTSYNTVRNTIQKSLNLSYLSQATSLRLNLIFWKSWVLGSTVTHNYYKGLSAGYNQNYVLWNASLGKKFLKDNAGELRLQVFDILKQNNSISRTVSDVYVEDTRTTVLQRYVMLTFTYTLRRFTSGSAPTGNQPRERRHEFMPPPGGMPPGGGPF